MIIREDNIRSVPVSTLHGVVSSGYTGTSTYMYLQRVSVEQNIMFHGVLLTRMYSMVCMWTEFTLCFRGQNARYMFELLAQFKRGECDGIKVRLGRLQEFVSSACVEHLDFLSDHSGRHHDIQFSTFQEKVRDGLSFCRLLI